MESQVSEDIPDRSMTPYKESDSERSQRNQYVKTEDIVHELDESQFTEFSAHKSDKKHNRAEDEKEVEVESMEDEEQRKAMRQYLGDMSIAANDPFSLENQSIE